MDAENAQQLWQAIRECGLYSPDALAAAEPALAAPGDDALFADRLEAAEVITPYQHRKIRTGRLQEVLFGPYLILDKLGEGGMGKVYRAVKAGDERVVALKVVRPHLMSNKTVQQRYKREAAAAAKLDHPNIVTLLDADDVNGRYYLAMEYIDGIDLARLLKEFGRPPTTGLAKYQEACEYIRQAALGLQHAHDHGLVHRDIKPSNLLVFGERALPGTSGVATVKILDMGLVRSLLDDDDVYKAELTRDGTVVGTPDYMSPEQAKNSSTVDHRADLYSLGCTLYFLLKGQSPFPDGSPIDKLLRHQLDPPPDLRRTRPDLPAGLVGVIEKLLKKSPADRYQSASAVAAALAPYCPGGVGDVRPADPEPFSLAADENSVMRTQPPIVAPTPEVLDAIPVTVAERRVTKALLVAPRSAAMPKVSAPSPLPKASAVPRPDPNPSTDSLPYAKAMRAATQRHDSGETDTRPPRRDRKPSVARDGGVPIAIIIAGVGFVVLAVVTVVVMITANGKKEGTTAVTTPLQSSPTSSPPTHSPVPPILPPTPISLLPADDVLPAGANGVLVIHPQAYWARQASEPVHDSKLLGHLDSIAARTRFDPRKCDRIVVTFTGKLVQHYTAVGEGAFADAKFTRELDDYVRKSGGRVIDLKPDAKLYNFSVWTTGPKYAAVLKDRAYVVAGERDVIAGLIGRGKRPDKISDDLFGAFKGEIDGKPPLISFGASTEWLLPDGSSLFEHQVRTLTAIVRLSGNQFEYDIVVTGRPKTDLAGFVEKYLAGKLLEQIPELAGFAKLVLAGTSTPKRFDSGSELRIQGKASWTAVQAALDQFLPAPPKPGK